MAARADVDLVRAIPKAYRVAAGQTVTAGRGVKFASTDQEIAQSGAGDGLVTFGIALDSGAAGEQVSVVLLGVQLVRAIVGTGGATRGVRQKLVSNGVTDVTDAAADIAVGQAIQSGVVGDEIGMLIGRGA